MQNLFSIYKQKSNMVVYFLLTFSQILAADIYNIVK